MLLAEACRRNGPTMRDRAGRAVHVTLTESKRSRVTVENTAQLCAVDAPF